jgi:hypothetical protein
MGCLLVYENLGMNRIFSYVYEKMMFYSRDFLDRRENHKIGFPGGLKVKKFRLTCVDSLQ